MNGEQPPGILIASPQMHDPNFEGTVLLLCHHDEQGALGVVINRATDLTVGEVVDEFEFDTDRNLDDAVLWGGPVEQASGFVVFPGEIGSGVGWTLDRKLSVSPSREMLQTILRGESPYHLCLGYAGWGPGQLESEITLGSWLYTDIDADLVLEKPVSERYERALKQLGVRPELIWMVPVDE
jgi:putative transcriptional regulator